MPIWILKTGNIVKNVLFVAVFLLMQAHIFSLGKTLLQLSDFGSNQNGALYHLLHNFVTEDPSARLTLAEIVHLCKERLNAISTQLSAKKSSAGNDDEKGDSFTHNFFAV